MGQSCRAPLGEGWTSCLVQDGEGACCQRRSLAEPSLYLWFRLSLVKIQTQPAVPEGAGPGAPPLLADEPLDFDLRGEGHLRHCRARRRRPTFCACILTWYRRQKGLLQVL